MAGVRKRLGEKKNVLGFYKPRQINELVGYLRVCFQCSLCTINAQLLLTTINAQWLLTIVNAQWLGIKFELEDIKFELEGIKHIT